MRGLGYLIFLNLFFFFNSFLSGYILESVKDNKAVIVHFKNKERGDFEKVEFQADVIDTKGNQVGISNEICAVFKNNLEVIIVCQSGKIFNNVLSAKALSNYTPPFDLKSGYIGQLFKKDNNKKIIYYLLN